MQSSQVPPITALGGTTFWPSNSSVFSLDNTLGNTLGINCGTVTIPPYTLNGTAVIPNNPIGTPYPIASITHPTYNPNYKVYDGSCTSNTCITTLSPAINCGEKTMTNYFYEYKLTVYDTSYSEEPKNDRALFNVKDSIELSPTTVLRDVVLMRHGKELSMILNHSEIFVDLVILRQVTINAKKNKDTIK